MRVGHKEKMVSHVAAGIKGNASLALMHGASFLICFVVSLADGAKTIGLGLLAGIPPRYFPAAFLGFVLRAVTEGDIYANSAYTAAAGVVAATRWISASAKKGSYQPAIIGGSLSLVFTRIPSLLMLGNVGIENIASLILDVALFILLGKAFSVSLSPALKKETVGTKLLFAFSLSCLIYAACNTYILYFSIGRIAAAMLCALATYELGKDIFGAAVFGAAAAIILSEPAFSFAAAGLCSAAVLCRTLAINERWARTMVFTLISSTFSLFGANHTFSALFLCENLAACFLYSILPGGKAKVSGKTAAHYSSEPEFIKKLDSAADALFSLSRSLVGRPATSGTISSVYQNAADRVCKDCPLSTYCWVKAYDSTVETLGKLNQVLINSGHINRSDIDNPIKSRCIALPELTEAINTEYFKLLAAAKQQYTQAKYQKSMAKQYELIAKMLQDIAAKSNKERKMSETPGKPLYLLEHSAMTLSRESKSGDVVKHFSTQDGYSYVVLADGMGSGTLAANDGKICCELIEKLLMSGFSPDVTAEMVNLLLGVLSDRETASAIDLFSFDLYSGNALFTKAGAAASYVMTKGSIKRLSSKSLPVGIMGEQRSTASRIKLEPGDAVLMISDGAFDKAAKLCHILAAHNSLSCEEMCCKAEQLYSGIAVEDDITVLFIKIAENSQ